MHFEWELSSFPLIKRAFIMWEPRWTTYQNCLQEDFLLYSYPPQWNRYLLIEIWLSQYHSITFGVYTGWVFYLWSSFSGPLLSTLCSSVVIQGCITDCRVPAWSCGVIGETERNNCIRGDLWVSACLVHDLKPVRWGFVSENWLGGEATWNRGYHPCLS